MHSKRIQLSLMTSEANSAFNVYQGAITASFLKRMEESLNKKYHKSDRTYLLDGFHGWRWVLVTAQVDHDPGDIAQEGDGDGGADKGQQGLDNTKADHIIPALRTIT